MNKSEYNKMFALEDRHFWFVGKRFFITVYLKKIKTPVKKILDVGCGTGGTTKFLEKFGRVFGIEKNETAIALAKKRGIKVIRGEAEKLPFEKNSFDLVTLFDVLYHKNISNVDKAIKEGRRMLKSPGFLLITDSAFDFLSGSHANLVYEKRRFTLNSLEQLLSENNFRIIRASYIFLSIFPFILIKRLFLDKIFGSSGSDVFNPPKRINYLLTNLLKIESFLLTYFKLPFGSSLIILAQKNE